MGVEVNYIYNRTIAYQNAPRALDQTVSDELN
jgi:hypothetical protein